MPDVVLYLNHVSRVSGAERSLMDLLRALDRSRYLPVLACPDGELLALAREAGIEVCEIPFARFHRTRSPIRMSSYALAWVAGTNALRKILRETGPKIVHANSATAHLYASSAARSAGVPSIWHARDLRQLPFPARGLCREADRIVAVSDAVADFLSASGFSRMKITRIYNGIDVTAWRDSVTGKDIRSELSLPPDSRIILMAGQLVPWKRHEDALRAMPLILRKVPQARLVIAGDDLFGDHAELKQRLLGLVRELNISDKVVFCGWRNDVPDLMAAAEVILVPSDAEPFGRVALEAMALGVPVVGTRAGGLPEVVRDGECGLLVVPRFPESLADACMRILLNRPLARSLGEAGRRRAEALFNIRNTVIQVEHLYESVMHPPLKWVRM